MIIVTYSFFIQMSNSDVCYHTPSKFVFGYYSWSLQLSLMSPFHHTFKSNEIDRVWTCMCLRLALRCGCLACTCRLVPHSVIGSNYNGIYPPSVFRTVSIDMRTIIYQTFHFFPVRCGLIPITFCHVSRFLVVTLGLEPRLYNF